ncbi:MAG: hypothetical protein RL007_2822 [Bacteroidota bacterium]|jgi:hypothetical protein
MTKLQYQILASLVLLLIVGVATLHAQPPPPPPPPGDPPCWPPPCVPVDGGIVFAVGAAAVFGGKKLYNSLKKNKGE